MLKPYDVDRDSVCSYYNPKGRILASFSAQRNLFPMALEVSARLMTATAANPGLAVFDEHICPPESVAERVGNTPLLKLRKIAAEYRGIEILGKAEWVNPGG